MLKMTCQGKSAIGECDEWLTSGSEGIVCEFAFDQDWNGLSKTAVFLAGNVQSDVVLTEENCVVPGEVLANPHCDLFVGVYGTNAGGTVVIPTIYARIGRIYEGTDPAGDETANPNQPVWAQIQGAMGDLSELQTEEKSSLVAAINEAAQSGGGSGGSSGVWLPNVDADGNLSWQKSDTNTPPASQNIRGAAGANGTDGYTPVKGTDYWTAEDRQDIVEDVLTALPVWTGGSY